MSTASNTLEFLYYLILHGQIMLNTLLAKLIKGLVFLIVLCLSAHAFFLIIGLVIPLFDYADLVWGDKNNVILLQFANLVE